MDKNSQPEWQPLSDTPYLYSAHSSYQFSISKSVENFFAETVASLQKYLEAVRPKSVPADFYENNSELSTARNASKAAFVSAFKAQVARPNGSNNGLNRIFFEAAIELNDASKAYQCTVGVITSANNKRLPESAIIRLSSDNPMPTETKTQSRGRVATTTIRYEGLPEFPKAFIAATLVDVMNRFWGEDPQKGAVASYCGSKGSILFDPYKSFGLAIK